LAIVIDAQDHHWVACASIRTRTANSRVHLGRVAIGAFGTLYFSSFSTTPRIARPAMQKFASVCRPALFAAALFAVPALAADVSKGDPKAGRALVYTCGGCHGVAGYKNAYPNYHVPRIAGQNFDYLVAALTEYKKGERSHPTMRAQGQSLSDDDIRNIAAYLSSLSASK
jgi:cytochrome c553